MSRRVEWRAVGLGAGRRSMAVLAAIVLAGLAWLGWPVWGSLSSPTAADAAGAAPVLLAALTMALVLLALATWLDAGRDAGPVALALALLLLNAGLRVTVNPGASGVEIVHALPLLAGAVAGAPAGFLVGAGGMLLSSALIDGVGAMLPGQMLIFGLLGALGGVLWRVRPLPAWLSALPLAMLAGPASGVLLNLTGWALQPGTTTTSFFPGLPPAAVAGRLWAYTVETSLWYDLTRGATTALLVACAGLPLLRVGQQLGLRPAGPPAAAPSPRLNPAAVRRRQDRDRLDTLWKTGDHS